MKKAKAPEERNPASGYRQMLLDKREQVMAGMGMKFDTLAAMGRVAEEDQAQISHDEFESLHLNSLDCVYVGLIEEALDRLRSGAFGICMACEQPIAAKRLQALPWARYCVTCQEQVGAMQDNDSWQTRAPV